MVRQSFDVVYLVLLPIHVATHAILKLILPNNGATAVSDIYR